LTSVAQNKFCREVAILRSCRNSNIVQFQGACVDQGATMLVTEFMEVRVSANKPLCSS
jgi:serine/threonine protein kinase